MLYYRVSSFRRCSYPNALLPHVLPSRPCLTTGPFLPISPRCSDGYVHGYVRYARTPNMAPGRPGSHWLPGPLDLVLVVDVDVRGALHRLRPQAHRHLEWRLPLALSYLSRYHKPSRTVSTNGKPV